MRSEGAEVYVLKTRVGVQHPGHQVWDPPAHRWLPPVLLGDGAEFVLLLSKLSEKSRALLSVSAFLQLAGNEVFFSFLLMVPLVGSGCLVCM